MGGVGSQASQLVSSMRTMTKHSLLIATAIDETARYDLMLARERSSPNSLLGSELDASNEPFVSSLKDPTRLMPFNMVGPGLRY